MTETNKLSERPRVRWYEAPRPGLPEERQGWLVSVAKVEDELMVVVAEEMYGSLRVMKPENVAALIEDNHD